MIVFYTKAIEGDRALLEGEEFRHAIQVLRKKQGDLVRFTDGRGGWYNGQIEAVGKGYCSINISDRTIESSRRPYRVCLAVAPTKSIDRFEWLLEKATEIGVDRIVPVWCRYSERATLRLDRLEKILIAAMKQSLQPFLPRLEDPVRLDSFLEEKPASAYRCYIAYIDHSASSQHLFDACQPGQDTLVLIGPEGDFSVEEVKRCVEQGFELVSLGKNRLRTETAAVVATHCITLRNETLLL
jgi:16S rRNA (uracil1498-N3)-methyltransferase